MKNVEEVWKPILKYEGLYEVSNRGRVVSMHSGEKREIIGYLNHGYRKVGLYKNGKMKLCFVHRLLMASFFGPSELDVNHKDLNRSNNNVENLEYVTMLQNSQHARANKLNWALKGDAHPNKKLTFNELVEVIFLRMVKTPIQPISEAYGIRADYIKSLRYRVEFNKAYNIAKSHL